MTSTTTRSSILGACLLALAAGGCASGKQPPQGGPQGPGGPGGPGGASRIDAGPVVRPISLFFAGMDADGDMRITDGEMRLGVDAAWKAMAAPDGVRALDYADWAIAAFGSADAHPAYVAFDNNFDGRITEDEFKTRLAQEFSLMDADKDGALIRAEMVARVIQRAQGPGAGPGGGQRPQRGDRPR